MANRAAPRWPWLPAWSLSNMKKGIVRMRWLFNSAPIEVLAFVSRETRLEGANNMTRPTWSICRAAFETYGPAYNAIPTYSLVARIANTPLPAVLIASAAHGRSQ